MSGCDMTILAPDATAIVQDQDGNELARENIASGAQQIITVNVATMINVAKGDFTGVFDLSVQDQNGFYNDYTEGEIISTLSLAASPKLGSIATVRILGGLLGANAIPVAWDNYSGDAISQDNTKFNTLIIVYVSADDVRIVNNVIEAPDFVAPEFTSAPTATNIAETSFDITAQLNENGTVYGYLLANGSPAPTVQEIIDNAQDSFTDSGSGGTLSFTGLTNETNYDVYVVAEDTGGNRQDNSTLVEVLTASAIFNPSTISPEYVYIDADNVVLDGVTNRVISAQDQLSQTDYSFEGDVSNGPLITVEDLLNTFDIQSSLIILRSDSLDSNVFFRNTFSLYQKVKLTDGIAGTRFFIHDQGASTSTRFYVASTSTGGIQVAYLNGTSTVLATTLNAVTIDGMQSGFMEIDIVVPNGGTIEIHTKLSGGNWINQPLSASQDGDMNGVDMSLYTNNTNKLRIGVSSVANTSTLSGFYRRLLIQPVAHSNQNRIDLSSIL